MKFFVACVVFVSVAITSSFAQSHPRDETSKNSKFTIRKNQSDPNALIISPERKSIGVIFFESSELLLSTPPNFPYSVSSEFRPNNLDLAWIIFSDESGFLDCVVISRDKRISFANKKIIKLLKRNEKLGKKWVEDFRNDFRKGSKSVSEKAEQGAAANP